MLYPHIYVPVCKCWFICVDFLRNVMHFYLFMFLLIKFSSKKFDAKKQPLCKGPSCVENISKLRYLFIGHMI